MSEERIERILKNTKFSMEMEGFMIDKEQEAIGRKLLTGELELADYIESVKKKYQRYAHQEQSLPDEDVLQISCHLIAVNKEAYEVLAE